MIVGESHHQMIGRLPSRSIDSLQAVVVKESQNPPAGDRREVRITRLIISAKMRGHDVEHISSSPPCPKDMGHPPACLAGSALVAPVAARSALLAGWPGVLSCSALLALGAQVRIPLPGTDVPLTLQSLAVLTAGFALSPPRAAAAMLLYLSCGAAGLPVFTPGSAGVLGSTGGYLVGFVAAAWLVSLLKGGGEGSFIRLVLAGTAGTAVVFASGVAWRAIGFSLDPFLAIATGFVPFVVKDGVQVLLAATLVVSLRDRHHALGGCFPSRRL